MLPGAHILLDCAPGSTHTAYLWRSTQAFKQPNVVPVPIKREPREIRKLAHLFRQHAETLVVEIHEDHVRE